jgi:hypothetical protein
MPALMRHTTRPVAASNRMMDPSAAAANTLPFALAGEKANAPELPTEVDHAVRIASVGLNSTNSAGGLRGTGLLAKGFNEEHPATMAIIAALASFAATRISFPFA